MGLSYPKKIRLTKHCEIVIQSLIEMGNHGEDKITSLI